MQALEPKDTATTKLQARHECIREMTSEPKGWFRAPWATGWRKAPRSDANWTRQTIDLAVWICDPLNESEGDYYRLTSRSKGEYQPRAFWIGYLRSWPCTAARSTRGRLGLRAFSRLASRRR